MKSRKQAKKYQGKGLFIRNFLEVSGDIVERVDPIFFSDPMMAAIKALGMM